MKAAALRRSGRQPAFPLAAGGAPPRTRQNVCFCTFPAVSTSSVHHTQTSGNPRGSGATRFPERPLAGARCPPRPFSVYWEPAGWMPPVPTAAMVPGEAAERSRDADPPPWWVSGWVVRAHIQATVTVMGRDSPRVQRPALTWSRPGADPEPLGHGSPFWSLSLRFPTGATPGRQVLCGLGTISVI